MISWATLWASGKSQKSFSISKIDRKREKFGSSTAAAATVAVTQTVAVPAPVIILNNN